MAPQTSPVVIGIVTRAEAMQTFLRERLTALGAQVQLFPTLQAVKEVLHVERFSGFVVELRTLVGASAAEKALAHALEQAFPFMRVNGNLSAGRLTGHIRGESLIGEAACASFLERYCRPFGLKQFRSARPAWASPVYSSSFASGWGQRPPGSKGTPCPLGAPLPFIR